MYSQVVPALIATLGTWGLTALGAASVLFFRHSGKRVMNLMLGLAAGVMVAASFWSLLSPAIERLESAGQMAWPTVSLGFLCGAAFMWASDKAVAFAMSKVSDGRENKRIGRIIMLVSSITLHNIPEGLAVGVAFGALAGVPYSAEAFMGAVSVAVGIGLQNLPEGAAVSLPMRREGCSRLRSFAVGQASGMVEPFAGVLGAIAVTRISSLLPFALSFAAGAMILVAVHELIPECQDKNGGSYMASMGIVAGFCIMMVLDVALG